VNSLARFKAMGPSPVNTFAQDLYFVSNLFFRLFSSKNSPAIITIVTNANATIPNVSVYIPETIGFGEGENDEEDDGSDVRKEDSGRVGDGLCCREITVNVTVFEVAIVPSSSSTRQ
jgi:hypothetical protein